MRLTRFTNQLLILSLLWTSLSVTGKAEDRPFINSLGMKFVPVPRAKVLLCTTVTTVAQYKALGLEYRTPKFAQGADYPAVNVNWDEANHFCVVLSAKEGRTYRLPTDDEWSAGVTGGKYPWGNQWPPPKGCGNYAGQEALKLTQAEAERVLKKGWGLIRGFSDAHIFTSPVESYSPNAHGLYDMGGNVWQWCDTAYKRSMNTPDALKAYPLLRNERTSSGMPYRVLRGGSWRDSVPLFLRSDCRNVDSPKDHDSYYGFRCVLIPAGASR